VTEPAAGHPLAIERPRRPALHPRVERYLAALGDAIGVGDATVHSVVLFGSAARGGFSESASDVDLLLVVADGTGPDARRRLRAAAERTEREHGFGGDPDARGRRLRALVERITGDRGSSFICTRADLLSGDVGRILGLHPVQALLVDRTVLRSILASAMTVRGEELLPRVRVPPIRRVDVLKAWFGFSSQLLLSAAVLPFLPDATRFAMGALKRSVHSCYFCHHGRNAPLEEEIAFVEERLGRIRALGELVALRREYRSSPGFTVRALGVVARLHVWTAARGRFPDEGGRGAR
jgi:hypothetical protein